MERQGSGIKKIIENYELEVNYGEDLKPEFYSDSSQFSVILKNLNYGKSLEEIVIASEKVAIESKNVTIEESINRLEVNKNTKAKALNCFRSLDMKVFSGERILLHWPGILKLQQEVYQKDERGRFDSRG